MSEDGRRPGPDARARLFYGWVIVGITFLTQFVANGTVFYAYGVLLTPLAEALGVSRFELSFGPPVIFIVGALAAPLIGQEIDRRSIRTLMLLGLLLLSAGFISLSRASSLSHLYLCFGLLLALGMALLGGIANVALVSNWFIRQRGTALGISQIGVSLSGFVMFPVTTVLVQVYGWRAACLLFGIVPLIVVTPLVWALVTNRPEDRGLTPDGDPVPGPGPGASPLDATPGGWTAKRILREPAIWIIALVVGFAFASNGGVILVVHSHVTDLGYTGAQAGTVASLMAGLAAVGKLVFGLLGDRLHTRGAMWLCLGVQAAGLILLLGATSHSDLILAGLVFGLGYGGVLPLWGLLLGAVFPREALGRALGITGAAMLPFEFLGFPLATWVFGQTGSYDAAFLIFLAFYAAAAVVLLALRLPRVPDRT